MLKLNLFNTNKNLKIGLIVLISLLLSIFLSQTLFIPGSSQINTKFVSDLKSKITSLVRIPYNTLLSLKKTKQVEPEIMPDISEMPQTSPTQPGYGHLTKFFPTAKPTTKPTIRPTTVISQASPTINPNPINIGNGLTTFTDPETNEKILEIDPDANYSMKEYTLTNGKKILVIKPL